MNFCGAKTRQGDHHPCRMAAGWGTPHPGFGKCRKHGGNTSSHIVRADRDAAIQFARGALAAEVALDPIAALLQSVRLAAGCVAYHRLKLGDSTDVDREAAQDYEQAVLLLNRCAKAAVDAGIAEREVRIAERLGDTIVAAAEEAIMAAKMDNAQRLAFAEAFAERLAQVEAAPELSPAAIADIIEGQAEAIDPPDAEAA